MPVEPQQAVEIMELSQNHEIRLRQLEAAVILLLAERGLTFRKAKIDKAEMLAEIEQVSTDISFTISNYAPQ